MRTSIQDLREKRQHLAAQMLAMTEKHKSDWGEEHTRQFDKLNAEVDSLDADIARAEAGIYAAGAKHLGTGRSSMHYVDQDTGERFPVLRGVDEIRAHYRSESQKSGRPHAGELPSLADFMRGVAGFKTTPEIRNALSVGTDSSGGFAVPHVVVPEILEALVPRSSLLNAGAGMVPMPGVKTLTTVALETIPTAAWRNEAANIAESDPTFRAVTVTARSLSFYFKVSRELLMDAANIDRYLRVAIAQSMAREIDRVGLRGTGTAPEPRGILNTSGIQAVANGPNGTSLATIRWANMLSAYNSIRGADAPVPTAAIMSPRSMTGFAGLADTTNQPLRRPQLLDPITFYDTSQVPNNLTVGTSTDCTEIYLGDFSVCSLFMRETLSVAVLDQSFALQGQVGFVGHSRVDIGIEYPKALSVITGVRP